MAEFKPFDWGKFAPKPRKKKGKGKAKKGTGSKANAWRAYTSGGKKR
jgi:hypothetical protein